MTLVDIIILGGNSYVQYKTTGHNEDLGTVCATHHTPHIPNSHHTPTTSPHLTLKPSIQPERTVRLGG